ncbi:flagellin FliC [Silvanigrella paludirubra]|uniref:Flagellin n=1 Tax=Silvanigrella paludirubra TaxID=2499159 RepID=A0A6N6VN99_9BACT|nr:flagellin [Silvanigrella paludirubra]KAB8036464.1 flagellin FliC [Silvanigrella paludirubra]
MGLRIQTNIQSLNAQRALSITTKQNDESIEKVSSGYRINKASDDAAGLAISEKLKADVRGLNMAKRNASDGISLLQTAEGGMNEIGNILSRLRELAVQGSSDTIGNKERGFIHKEFNALKDEVDRITNSTEYNGTLLLTGKPEEAEGGLPEDMTKKSNPPPLEVQVGKNWSEMTDGQSDPFNEEFARNPVNIIRLNFDKINTSTVGLGIGRASDESLESTGVSLEGGDHNDSKLRAQASINKLDDAISKVSEFRADMGALQNRLYSTISNLSVQSENYSAANSRIRDTDFAEETAKLAQSNILKQGGVAVLAQANQSPGAAMRLLG